jgi:hypothetical protein
MPGGLVTGGARVQRSAFPANRPRPTSREVRAEAAVVVGGLGVFGFVEAEEFVVFRGAQADRFLDGPGDAESEDG